MSARAGVSPRSSSSFYWGEWFPRCHNKTLAAAKLSRVRAAGGGREEAHAFAAELISEPMSLLQPPPPTSLPQLPLPSFFCYDLIVSCLATPTHTLIRTHIAASQLLPAHTPPPRVSSVNIFQATLRSVNSQQNQRKPAVTPQTMT